MSLTDLIRGRSAGDVATATSATSATEGQSNRGSVARVATVAVATVHVEKAAFVVTSAEDDGERARDAAESVECPPLAAAITDCCTVRGDSDEHRRALLADCYAVPAEDWPDLTRYFREQMEARLAGVHQPARQPASQVTEAPAMPPCGDCRHFQPSPYNPTGGMGTCAIQAEAQQHALLLPWTMLKCKAWSATTGGRRVGKHVGTELSSLQSQLIEGLGLVANSIHCV